MQWGRGNVYSYLCRFLSFPLFFFFVPFVFFFFPFCLADCGSLLHFFFFLFPFAVSFFRFPRPIISIFFFHQVSFLWSAAPFVTLHPHPHTHSSSSRTFSSWPAGDQLVAEGVTHISCHHTRIRSGGQEKIKQMNKHEQSLGLTQEQKESYATLCIPDSIYGLTIAWVTSENSTKQLECRHLDSSSSLDPIMSATGLRSPVLTALVRGSTPTLCCPDANCLSAPFVQPTLIRVPLPLPDTARFQVQESFVWFRAKTDKGIVCFGGLPI